MTETLHKVFRLTVEADVFANLLTEKVPGDLRRAISAALKDLADVVDNGNESEILDKLAVARSLLDQGFAELAAV